MLSIFKRFSSLASLLLAPFRAIWRGVVHIFPEREFTIITVPNGDVTSYRQTSFWRFTKWVGKFGLIVWSAWATYVFMYHRPMLQDRTRQLEEVRDQHARQMSDLNTYYKKFTDLSRQINVLDDQILNVKKDDHAAAENLVKQRLSIWSQLDLLQAQLHQMFLDGGYAPEFTKLSELSMEYDLARAENQQLKAQNVDISENAQRIYDADTQITDHVTKLAADQTDFLRKQLKTISGTLATLGLSEKDLARRGNEISTPVVGAALPMISLDGNLDPKYQELADAVELWQGLARARIIMPLGAPVANPHITSTYGSRADPFDGEQKMHRGIDFAGAIGTPLYAPAPGRVIFAGEKNGYGRTVEIDHGLGFTTLYAHLSRITVRRGDNVRANEVVGLGGSTGRSTGPHLHYEIRYNDAPFNPYSFIQLKNDGMTE